MPTLLAPEPLETFDRKRGVHSAPNEHAERGMVEINLRVAREGRSNTGQMFIEHGSSPAQAVLLLTRDARLLQRFQVRRRSAQRYVEKDRVHPRPGRELLTTWSGLQ